MSRRIIMLTLVALLASGVSVAGDMPWFDMENCAMCKNVYDNKGLMENTLITYLNDLGVETIKKGEVDILAILPTSFKADYSAYSI